MMRDKNVTTLWFNIKRSKISENFEDYLEKTTILQHENFFKNR